MQRCFQEVVEVGILFPLLLVYDDNLSLTKDADAQLAPSIIPRNIIDLLLAASVMMARAL